MRKITTLCTLLFAAHLLSGCGAPPHHAQARILVEGSETQPAFFAAQVEKVNALAIPLAPDGAKVTVTHIRDTRFISIAVTMVDPNTIAVVCNRIAEAYVAEAEDGVKKILVEKAGLPTT